MKEEFNEETKLSKQLDEYNITIPTERLHKKRSYYERFLHYLASPTKDPLEYMTASSSGLFLLKMLPVPAVLLLAFLQGTLL